MTKEDNIKEIETKISVLKQEANYYNALQLALKLVLNGSYGAFAAQYFILFNNQVAGTITAEGRELTRTMSDVNEDYWYNVWHLDKELHKELFIKNVTQIAEGTTVSVYGDSISGDSIISTDKGDFTIAELFLDALDKLSIRTDKEVLKANFESINWTEEKGIHLSKVKNIIRHKSSKRKYIIKAGDKKITVTEDHSLIVFRNGVKTEIKPTEIKSGDKVLINNIKATLFEIEPIEILEPDDDYVYDLEMEDESHTFIANDILVHNTDSIFVGFEPAIKSCDWQNIIFNEDFINGLNYSFMTLTKEPDFHIGSNKNNKGHLHFDTDKGVLEMNGETLEAIPSDMRVLMIDGSLVKNYELQDLLSNYEGRVLYNWAHELDFIHGLDFFRVANYFKEKLTDHANSYGVENVQDFELEKISESIINLEKKKYIQHITWEDGIDYERFKYFQPKGVELVRSSTPLFARDKENGIYRIIKYLFAHPSDFNIKELLAIVKDMRKAFELADMNEVSGQSSCSNYTQNVLDDKKSLSFVTGAHFAVKAAAFHNYLLHQNPKLQNKYEFLKSGDKIKYYYTTDPINPIFAFKRGEFPHEFAPPMDYTTQYHKVILSPINSIVSKLGMPEINKRLNVIMDLLGGL